MRPCIAQSCNGDKETVESGIGIMIMSQSVRVVVVQGIVERRWQDRPGQ
jgi:hypothetical protein